MILESILFAKGLQSKLRHGSLKRVEKDFYQVTGQFETEMAFSPVEICVWQNALRQVPPKVFCREDWMRDNPDWHNSKDVGMCWVLEEQWRDEMDRDDLTPKDFVDLGILWLTTAVSSLMDRHYVGHYMRLKEWPPEWEAYPHGKPGADTYERGKRRRFGDNDSSSRTPRI